MQPMLEFPVTDLFEGSFDEISDNIANCSGMSMGQWTCMAGGAFHMGSVLAAVVATLLAVKD